MKYTALEIAEILNGKIDGISSEEVTSLNKIEESTKDSITFLANKKYIPWVYKTKASIIIVSEDFKPKKNIPATLIRVKDPYIGFVKLLHKFDDSSIKTPVIKDSAVISSWPDALPLCSLRMVVVSSCIAKLSIFTGRGGPRGGPVNNLRQADSPPHGF